MSRTLANPTEMIRLGAPRVIHSDKDLAAYTEALFALTAKVNLTPEDEEAIELLTVLIDHYESKHYPVPAAEPIDVLRFLLDQNGLSQRDISEEVGGESTVSLILSGKRQLNRDHIARLSSASTYRQQFSSVQIHPDKAIMYLESELQRGLVKCFPHKLRPLSGLGR